MPETLKRSTAATIKSNRGVPKPWLLHSPILIWDELDYLTTFEAAVLPFS